MTTVRGAVGGAVGAGSSDSGGHRTRAAKRVPFEALVAVADVAGQRNFEAESVDVSPEGMRLRTAYLPEVGERLVCRFDDSGEDIVAEGEVLWRLTQARGGEFALRFSKLDESSSAALIGWGFAQPDAKGIGAQNVLMLVINLIGVYQYLIRKKDNA